MIFQKPFITCIQCHDSIDSRVVDLLKEIGGMNHAKVYNKCSDIEIPFGELENYIMLNITELKNKSLKYLISSLNK